MDGRGTGIADAKYIELVKKEGLYNQAFFGTKKTKKQQRKLNSLWKVAQAFSENQIAKQDRVAKLLAARSTRGVHRSDKDEGDLGSIDSGSQTEEGAS